MILAYYRESENCALESWRVEYGECETRKVKFSRGKREERKKERNLHLRAVKDSRNRMKRRLNRARNAQNPRRIPAESRLSPTSSLTRATSRALPSFPSPAPPDPPPLPVCFQEQPRREANRVIQSILNEILESLSRRMPARPSNAMVENYTLFNDTYSFRECNSISVSLFARYRSRAGPDT